MTTIDETPLARAGRRAELAAFLRARRTRITPPTWACRPGSRRRTPGLRREEVAVARTLRLDQAEIERLHLTRRLATR